MPPSHPYPLAVPRSSSHDSAHIPHLCFPDWASSSPLWPRRALAWADEPRFNQIQVIGSHNSYHVAPAPAIWDMLVARNPQRAQGLDYTHPPLAEQFSNKDIRQVELDVYADPKGGLFAAARGPGDGTGIGKDPGRRP